MRHDAKEQICKHEEEIRGWTMETAKDIIKFFLTSIDGLIYLSGVQVCWAACILPCNQIITEIFARLALRNSTVGTTNRCVQMANNQAKIFLICIFFYYPSFTIGEERKSERGERCTLSWLQFLACRAMHGIFMRTSIDSTCVCCQSFCMVIAKVCFFMILRASGNLRTSKSNKQTTSRSRHDV